MLPLLIDSSPLLVKDSPVVMIQPGKYRLVTDKKDTILNLAINGEVHLEINDREEFEAKFPTKARVSVVKSGNEQKINVSLEKI